MQQLFENVLVASFHGGVVIVAVVLLRLLLKKTPAKFLCLMWMLAFIRLLMPFEIQSTMSLQPEPEQIVQEVVSPLPYIPEELMAPVADALVPEQQDAPVFHGNGSGMDASGEDRDAQTPAQSTVTVETGGQSVDLKLLIPWIWLGGVSGFALWCIVSYLRLKRQVRFAVKIPGGWECDRIDTAFILGFIRPKIYIPMGMPTAVRSHILAHERTHLEKGDHWIKMIGYVALAVHWFSPLVWVAYILLCKDIEMACDERVVQFMELEERKAYSAALLTCSTNRAHFAACPVAFGEVSVKERIMKVLNYRRPSFWISLLGVAAIVFLVICLMTSPAREPGEQDDIVPAQETTEGTQPAQGYLSGLSDAEAMDAAKAAMAQLREQEVYYIQSVHTQESSIERYPEYRSTGSLYRSGENILVLMQDEGSVSLVNSWMYLDGVSYTHLGDYWMKDAQGTPYGAGAVLNNYIGADLNILEGSWKKVDADTVSFLAQWKGYEGTYYLTFRVDGSLSEIYREYSVEADEWEKGEVISFTNRLTVMDMPRTEVDALMQTHAAEAISGSDVERLRREAQQTTEVPSNKTDYDKDFMLGSGQMGWQMLDGEWFFKFGAENVSTTGLTIAIEYSGAYGNSTIPNATVTAGTEYFLEELVDGVWTTIPPIAAPFTPIAAQSLNTGSRQTINWTNNYGELPGGFYRIGNYYTATTPSGETDTQVCYAKFRLYDPSHDALLKEARNAIDELMNRESYHLYAFDWMTEHDYEYYLSREVWKHGQDYLEVIRYPLREDVTQMQNVRGSMWRGGKYYGLEWEGDPTASRVSSWWQGVDGYMDNSNFSMWSWDYQWYDANVELVYREGDTIRILQTYDYSDKYECSEITLRFDQEGRLCGMVSAYLPTRSCPEKDKVIRCELVVYDSSPQEIGTLIQSQDVTTPIPFSYEEDVANHPEAQTEGFRNTYANPITICAQAVALANRESAMPQILNFDNGYLQTRVYRDEAAGMWKVELFWWQHDTAQTVYMTDEGITTMMLSVE